MRRREARRSTRFAVLVALSSLAPSPAAAEPGLATVEPARRHRVTVTIAGEPAAIAVALDVLRERIGGAGTDVSFEVVSAIDRASVVTPGPPDDQQLARVWIDLTARPSVLYVVDGPWEHVLVRTVVPEENPEIASEEIGHIVELALGALRAGETIGVGRAVAREELHVSEPPAKERPAETAPGPPPAPRASESAIASAARRLRVRAGGYYSARAYGPGLARASGPGIVVELHATTRLAGRALSYGPALMAEYRLPSTVERRGDAVRFDGAAGHVLASASYALAPRHELVAFGGGGIELMRAHGSSARPNVCLVDPGLAPILAARAVAGYGWSTPAVRLFGGLGLDVPLDRPRYFIAREGRRDTLFEPWAVRPFVLIGVELLGSVAR